jgi:hypothetical protein
VVLQENSSKSPTYHDHPYIREGENMRFLRKCCKVKLLMLSFAIISFFSTACTKNIPLYLEKYANNAKAKIQLKAYFPKEIYRLKYMFLEGTQNDYDVKIVSEITNYSEKKLYVKTTGKKGNYETNSSFAVTFNYELIIYDSSNNMLFTFIDKEKESGESFAFGLKSAVSESRAKRYALNNAFGKIGSRLEAKLVNEISGNSNIHNFESQISSLKQKGFNHKPYTKGKIPFTCVLSLPPHIDNIKAIANFNRSFHINYEKQAGSTAVNIGKELKNHLCIEMEKMFSEFRYLNALEEGYSIKYNPYDITCLIDIEYRDTRVMNEPSARVNLDASAIIKTATGKIYKKIDISSQGNIASGKGSGFLAEILGDVSIIGVLTEGSFINQAFKNGCNDAVKHAVEKIKHEFNSDFVKRFPEFSAYDTASKSKSLTDIQHFLSTYPKSEYADNLRDIMDDLLYDFAVSANLIEPYVEYLKAAPKGKYKLEIQNKLDQMLFDEIKKGNKHLCRKYIHLLPKGENINAVKKICGFK